MDDDQRLSQNQQSYSQPCPNPPEQQDRRSIHHTYGNIPQPIREDGASWWDLGPRNIARDLQNPNMIVPPATDAGTFSNLRFSFSDTSMQLNHGGWSREITVRELPIAKTIAGVNMALTPGGFRELHWHQQAEWAIMLVGRARITAVDQKGRNFIADVSKFPVFKLYFSATKPYLSDDLL